jgi:hypothetical protein
LYSSIWPRLGFNLPDMEASKIVAYYVALFVFALQFVHEADAGKKLAES